MEKVEEVQDRVSLIFRLQPDYTHPSWGYIAQAILCHSYCYRVLISSSEARYLLLNSSADDVQSHPLPNEFPLLEEVVDQIRKRPQFLNETRLDGGLSGTKVREYFDRLKEGEKLGALGEILIRAKGWDMRSEGTYYVADGMHRLIAYAYWTGLGADSFPIELYFCTEIAL